MDLRRGEPLRAALDEEAADRAVVRPRPDDRDVRDRPVRDPHLRPVQHPVRAVAACVRSHRARVGPGIRLREPEAADRLAGVHRRQPALLLLLRAPAPDRVHRERSLHRDGAPHAGVARLELAADDAVGDRARAGEAVALEVHPEQAQLRQLAEQLAREDPLLEPVAHVGEDTLADEPPDGVADRPLLVVEQAVDVEKVVRVERATGLGRGRHPVLLVRRRDRSRGPLDGGSAQRRRWRHGRHGEEDRGGSAHGRAERDPAGGSRRLRGPHPVRGRH